ncbi:unnamed protein product [Closterium sp. NIES-64]|nr:unnamed protein product [Closterium sp. NIES-64]
MEEMRTERRAAEREAERRGREVRRLEERVESGERERRVLMGEVELVKAQLRKVRLMVGEEGGLVNRGQERIEGEGVGRESVDGSGVGEEWGSELAAINGFGQRPGVVGEKKSAKNEERKRGRGEDEEDRDRGVGNEKERRGREEGDADMSRREKSSFEADMSRQEKDEVDGRREAGSEEVRPQSVDRCTSVLGRFKALAAERAHAVREGGAAEAAVAGLSRQLAVQLARLGRLSRPLARGGDLGGKQVVAVGFDMRAADRMEGDVWREGEEGVERPSLSPHTSCSPPPPTPLLSATPPLSPTSTPPLSPASLSPHTPPSQDSNGSPPLFHSSSHLLLPPAPPPLFPTPTTPSAFLSQLFAFGPIRPAPVPSLPPPPVHSTSSDPLPVSASASNPSLTNPSFPVSAFNPPLIHPPLAHAHPAPLRRLRSAGLPARAKGMRQGARVAEETGHRGGGHGADETSAAGGAVVGSGAGVGAGGAGPRAGPRALAQASERFEPPVAEQPLVKQASMTLAGGVRRAAQLEVFDWLSELADDSLSDEEEQVF